MLLKSAGMFLRLHDSVQTSESFLPSLLPSFPCVCLATGPPRLWLPDVFHQDSCDLTPAETFYCFFSSWFYK